MDKELEKEYEKLGDLEFEYNLMSKFRDDEIESTKAYKLMQKQLEKIKKIEEEISNEESDVKTQEK